MVAAADDDDDDDVDDDVDDVDDVDGDDDADTGAGSHSNVVWSVIRPVR